MSSYFDNPSAIQRLIWEEKYRQPGEVDIIDSLQRVVRGVYAKDPSKEALKAAMDAVLAGDWVPAGRIHAGAGTDKRVTLINCYVSPTIQDSLATEQLTGSHKPSPHGELGIMEALNNAAYTMQMGGGIGMDFSTIRPKGALVKRTGSVSSGVLPFMDMWHSMCATIMSSGSRRGAMIGCLRIDHPDVPDFIEAKQTPSRLTNFNVSVLVTDAFMKAVKNDELWKLHFPIPPANPDTRASIMVIGADGKSYGSYRYKSISARELWDKLLKATYEFAEPGVIFIDRVNSQNNLNYCETIAATNPCGEQPLPPNGACNLGAVNLANMVLNPFTLEAHVDWDRLEHAVRVGVRFLDNVLDVTQYPTEAQKQEAINKRRIGLGITGLANMLQQLGLEYGSNQSLEIVGRVMRRIAEVAYATSNQLAQERGPFPLWDSKKFNYSLVNKLDLVPLVNSIERHGLRNGVLLTIAPTGTTSIYYGNVSSGLEPVFALEYTRKVLQQDGTHKVEKVRDWGYERWLDHLNASNLDAADNPSWMKTAMELTVDDHLAIQAACQKWVDASISKTINCPTEMTFDEFKQVYTKAYELGCKGCTTYRLSGVRGSVLSVEEPKDGVALKSEAHPDGPEVPEDADVAKESLVKGTLDTETMKITFPRETTAPRPRVLRGTTYKIRWPKADHAHYVTINDDEHGVPFELFINSKSVLHTEWVAAVTRLISAVFRKGGDIHFLVDELKQVHATEGGAWINGKYVPSMVAMLGEVIQEHLLGGPEAVEEMKNETQALRAAEAVNAAENMYKGALLGAGVATSGLMVPLPPNTPIASLITCKACGQPTAYKQEGCLKCLSCGHSDCG